MSIYILYIYSHKVTSLVDMLNSLWVVFHDVFHQGTKNRTKNAAAYGVVTSGPWIPCPSPGGFHKWGISKMDGL